MSECDGILSTMTAVLSPMLTSLAFLGPAGTYGEQACRRLARLNAAEQARFCPQPTIRAVVSALLDGQVDGAVVPVENSVEGGVTSCLDLLWKSALSPAGVLCIQQALILPIRHALLSDGEISQVSEVLSHPQALAQCAAWLQEHLPQALQLPTSSTAEAARLVKGSRFRAAVASRQAGLEQGVNELAYPISDQAGNCTRFLLLRRAQQPVAAAVTCTSLAFSLYANAPGALLQVLQVFAARQLNMSRIESRPSKRELGEYVFFVDLETRSNAEIATALVSELQQVLEPLCERLAWFGTYPVIDDTGLL